MKRVAGVFTYVGAGDRCQLCRDKFDMYVVKDAVWKAAKLKETDNVCLYCLSDRLERKIRLRDFIIAPVNSHVAVLLSQSQKI